MAKRKYLKVEEMQKIEILNLNVKLSQYKIDNEVLRMNEKLKSLNEQLKNEKLKLKNYTTELKKDFKMTGDKFGYNPDTGEVIDE